MALMNEHFNHDLRAVPMTSRIPSFHVYCCGKTTPMRLTVRMETVLSHVTFVGTPPPTMPRTLAAI